MQWRRHAPSPGLPYRGARGELPVMATNPVHALVPDASIIKRSAGSHDGVRRARKVVAWRKCPSYSLCWAPSRAALRTHTDLALENLALRQQLALPRRRSKRPQFALLDRLLWVWLSNQWAGWRDALHVLRPETVIRWHRQGFRAFWTWKSRRGRTGRPRYRLGDCPACPHHGARQSPLGRAAHPRRTAQAGVRRFAADRCASHAAPLEAKLADLANVPREPHRRPPLHRLLPRTDCDLRCALRVRGATASSPPSRALQRDRFPNRGLDRAADHRGVPPISPSASPQLSPLLPRLAHAPRP